MGQIQEPVFIEAFITEFPDEAFGKGITRRLRGSDVLNRNGSHLCPLVKDGIGKLWAVINSNPFRIPGNPADLIEKGYELPSRD